MNILLAIVPLVLSFSPDLNGTTSTTCCPSYICEMRDIIFPDLLCTKRGEPSSIFGYIPVKTYNMPITFDRNYKRGTRIYGLRATRFCYDSYFLDLACGALKSSGEVEILVYEMLLRLIASYLKHCEYPKQYCEDEIFENIKCNNQELKGCAYTSFCKLISHRNTRDVVLIVLYDLLGYIKSCGGCEKREKSSTFDLKLHDMYADYLFKAVSFILSKVNKISLIHEAENRKISSKSFILIPTKYASNTGNLVIDATTFMDDTIPF